MVLVFLKQDHSDFQVLKSCALPVVFCHWGIISVCVVSLDQHLNSSVDGEKTE